MKISALGCCLIDYVYQNVSYEKPDFQRLVSKVPGDGGIIPGGLVFTEDLEKFARLPLGSLVSQLVGATEPDTINLGGPGAIALANVAQLLGKLGGECTFYGWTGDDDGAVWVREFLETAGVTTNLVSVKGASTPSTLVLSDPHFHGSHGERSFLNTIGAAGVPRARDIDKAFFEADIVVLGGTALTPGLHDDLTLVLKKAKEHDCITVVGTVFDFRNEKRNPRETWPLGEPDSCPYIDVLVCDAVEARRISGEASLEGALKELLGRGAKTVLITNGEQDLLVASQGGLFDAQRMTRYPVHPEIGKILKTNPEKFADTTGCGDNFLGGLVASISMQLEKGPGPKGLDLGQTIAWASSSGGFACFYPGGLYREKHPGEKLAHITSLVHQYPKKPRSLVQWGAGNIGRSFIGQIFGRNGWAVTFVDVFQPLLDALNSQGGYRVIEVSDQYQKTLEISGVRAVSSKSIDEVNEAIAQANLVSVSVGKNILPRVIPDLCKALAHRYELRPSDPVDILIAENMTDGAEFFRSSFAEAFRQHGLPDFPFLTYVGFVETSLGKMVPIQTSDDLLTQFAEPYNTLILDRNGFLGSVPNLPEIKAVESMKAWVSKKLYIHNLGHAAAAYLGFAKRPGATFLWEVLQDPSVFEQTRNAMNIGARIIELEHPGVFTRDELDAHIQDLLSRFQNRALGDTVYRVGRDVARKLNANDRIGGALVLAWQHNLDVIPLLKVFLAGLAFEAADPETGKVFPQDRELQEAIINLDLEGKVFYCLGSKGWEKIQLKDEFMKKIHEVTDGNN